MCGKFELITKFGELPNVLKIDYPSELESKYETQNLIRPTDPVLVIKNEIPTRSLKAQVNVSFLNYYLFGFRFS